MKNQKKVLTSAMSFILLMGIVSMLSDMTHEGASSVLGAFLSVAGASAATIGFVSGLGEMIGYSLRLLTGIVADKTRAYWPMTILGYAIDVLAIPALALVPEHGWKMACALIMIERAGKAIKKPAKNTLLSFAAAREGAGKSFAIQECLDQIGAFLGPLILFAVMLLKRGGDIHQTYRLCFAVLASPALLTMAALLLARRRFPNPENFEPETQAAAPFKMKSAFLCYIAAISLFAMGFIDFSLITMHVSRTALIPTDTLPLLYAAAMLIDAVSAFVFGRLYDRRGFRVLMLSTAISAPFAVFVFGFHSIPMTVLGVLLWGVGMGAQESILKAAVVTIVPKQNRSTGFGVFETSFGLFWFLGSWLMGVLYDCSVLWMIAFSVGAQLLAIPLFAIAARRQKA